MSSIPPNWLGSIIQSQGAQARAAEKSARESADQARATDRGSFSENLNDIIENVAGSGDVDPDAEGTGSQGRAFSSGDGENPDADDGPSNDAGDARPGAGGLDVSA